MKPVSVSFAYGSRAPVRPVMRAIFRSAAVATDGASAAAISRGSRVYLGCMVSP